MSGDRGGAGGTSGVRRFGISDAMILTAGLAVAMPASMHLVALLVNTSGGLGGEDVSASMAPGRPARSGFDGCSGECHP